MGGGNSDSDRHHFLGRVHSDFYYDITRTYVCGKKIYIYPCLASEYKLCRNSILPAWNWKYGWHSVRELGLALLTNQLDDEAAKVICSLLSHTEFISFLKLILDAFHLPLGWTQSKTMIYHILLTHLFIAQLLLLSKRHSMWFPKETESTFHFIFNWQKFNWRRVLQSSSLISRWQLQRGRGDGDGHWDSVQIRAESRSQKSCQTSYCFICLEGMVQS